MQSIPHMITHSTTSGGTAIEVPRERAPATHLKTHHFQPNPEVRSFRIPNPAPRHRQVKGIAVRFASLPPRSGQNPVVRLPSVRKSLTLSPENKVHSA
jgi:hypothetical protein